MLLRKIQETIEALFFIPNAKNYGTSYERRYEPSKRQRREAHKLVELPLCKYSANIPHQVVIEAEDAKKLLEVYTYEWN